MIWGTRKRCNTHQMTQMNRSTVTETVVNTDPAQRIYIIYSYIRIKTCSQILSTWLGGYSWLRRDCTRILCRSQVYPRPFARVDYISQSGNKNLASGNRKFKKTLDFKSSNRKEVEVGVISVKSLWDIYKAKEIETLPHGRRRTNWTFGPQRTQSGNGHFLAYIP